jgi:DNA-binding CsgD family transcriptional regulator
MLRQRLAAESGQPLLGRRAECAAIAQVLDAVRDGFGGVMVLTGEPGVGKTRLLDHADSQASDITVVRVVGVESETRLAYGAVHRLLRPFLRGLTNLPGHLQEALNAAFGLTGAPPSDRFLVGLATLTLLADVASHQPMLCLIDDAHWVDRESAEVLGFVARRLQAESLAMIFAGREGASVLGLLDTLNVVALQGLAADDARDLLERGVTGHLDPTVADRIVSGTGGNPLALRELAALLGPEQLAGVARLPEPLPVNRLLEEHFRTSVTALPDDTQTLLLLMAATPTDDQATLWRAASTLGLSVRAAAPAVAAGLLNRATTTDFRHPLIRSAVYSAAADDQRRRIHAALAATSGEDRRAWHLAEATAGTDDAVAAELDAASERARARGGYSEQALFLSRAAELTTDPARRADRYLGAATAHLLSGDPAAVQTLLDIAIPDLATPAARARAKRIVASRELLYVRPGPVAAMLLEAVAELGCDDPATTWELMYEAVCAAIVSGNLTQGTTLAEVAKKAATAWYDPAPPPWSPGPLMYGLALDIGYGYAHGAPVLRDALWRLRASAEIREVNNPFSVTISHAADELWDIDAKRDLVERVAAADRSHGALFGLSLALIVLASVEIWDGRFAAAADYYAESDEYAAATGFPGQGKINRALLYAWTGQEKELRDAAYAMNHLAETFGLGALSQIANHALSLLEIARGCYREALDHVLVLFTENTVAHGNLALPIQVEAGVRAGDLVAAAAALARIEERAPLAGTPWALGILARCRALMADDDSAEEFYQQSIELLGKVPVAVELAWSRLVYGEWLRRRKRRSDARVQLRAAFESFGSWGAALFADRARAELLATGETARKRRVGTQFDLTPQERHVATLAASGLTNAEIASRIFVTRPTVEYHLNKVFRKLGITSRRQIAALLGETGLA